MNQGTSTTDTSWVQGATKWAIIWILTPFFITSAWFVAFRVIETKRGIDHLRSIAASVVSEMTTDETPTGSVLIDSIVSKAAYDPAADIIGLQNYRLLVRTLHHQISISEKSPEAFLADFRNTLDLRLYGQTLGISFLQVALVLFFPGMFIKSVSVAKRQILSYASETAGEDATDSLKAMVRSEHSQWLLKNETRPMFWRRFGFAWLITLGTAYLFAPGGFDHATAVAFVYVHATPSEPSLSVWFDQFHSIPPGIAGFAGFLLYAFTAFINQYRIETLCYRTLTPLFVRGITVFLISLLLSAVPDSGMTLTALAFVVGVFPQIGIEALSKVAKAGVGRFTLESSDEFRGIPEIDLWKEVALQEFGVRSLHDLAKSNMMDLVITTGINPSLLQHAIDRSILLHVFGSELAEKLLAVPIRTASQYVLYLKGRAAYGAGHEDDDLGVEKLTEEERHRREDVVAETLGIRDPAVPLYELMDNANLTLILEWRRKYRDS